MTQKDFRLASDQVSRKWIVVAPIHISTRTRLSLIRQSFCNIHTQMYENPYIGEWCLIWSERFCIRCTAPSHIMSIVGQATLWPDILTTRPPLRSASWILLAVVVLNLWIVGLSTTSRLTRKYNGSSWDNFPFPQLAHLDWRNWKRRIWRGAPLENVEWLTVATIESLTTQNLGFCTRSRSTSTFCQILLFFVHDHYWLMTRAPLESAESGVLN